VFFKGPKAILVYRAGLTEPHSIQARATAVRIPSPSPLFQVDFCPAEGELRIMPWMAAPTMHTLPTSMKG